VTKTERKLPISDAEVAARLLNTTQRGLADELGVSKTAIANARARHERARERRREASRRTPGADHEHQVEGEPERMASGPVNILARLEHEAIHSKDGRSRIAALKHLGELREHDKLCPSCGGKPTPYGPFRFRPGTVILEPTEETAERWHNDKRLPADARWNLWVRWGRAPELESQNVPNRPLWGLLAALLGIVPPEALNPEPDEE
jgi:hypothetical protein